MVHVLSLLKSALRLEIISSLKERFFPYTKQKVKSTLKRPDNSLLTESLQNHLTQENLDTTIAISSADTSEKTTMETDVVMQARDWAINRIETMGKTESVEHIYDRLALMDEWYEWFDLDKMDGMDYIVLEDTTQNSESEI